MITLEDLKQVRVVNDDHDFIPPNPIKHKQGYSNGLPIDNIDLTNFEPKTFITIAPRLLYSKEKILIAIRTVFDYFDAYTSASTSLVYGIETNSNYFEEHRKGIPTPLHFHAVTDANFNPIHKKNIYNILVEVLGSEYISEAITVQVVPYLHNIGIGGIAYTIKENYNTGLITNVR